MSTDVLFISQVLTEHIATGRGLRSSNASGSNRVLRLASAMRTAGATVHLLSPGGSLRPLWRGRLLHPTVLSRVAGFPCFFSASSGLQFANLLCEPISLVWLLVRLFALRRYRTVIVYDYYPSLLLAAAFARIVFRTRLILDLEDVCLPHWSDWTGRGDQRPVQQLLGWLLMRIALCLSHGVIVPSQRFIAAASVQKPTAVVSGCIDVVPAPATSACPVRFMISGLLDREQGVYMVLDGIGRLKFEDSSGANARFDICGFSDGTGALEEQVKTLAEKGVNIEYHGAVPKERYTSMLRAAHVCLAMQNPGGRHSQTKTPSKVYEYLAYGKVVIASRVGDFDSLPPDIIELAAFDEESIARSIRTVSENWDEYRLMGERAASYAAENFASAVVGRKILAL